jgi:nucleotide-binding universal stress UspA family protein
MLATATEVAVSFERVIIPTDFSAESRAVIPYARALAEHRGSSIHFVHVVDPLPYRFGPEAESRTTREQTLSLAERDLAKFAAESCIARPCSKIVEGDFATEIRNYAEKHRASVLLVGSKSALGLEKLLVGSKAEEIVRSAPCPVLIVGPEAGSKAQQQVDFKKVLFATDFSGHSLAALPYVLGLHERFGSKLLLLYVVHPDIQSPAERQRMRRKYIDHLQMLVPASILRDVEPIVEFGDVEDTILEFARFEETDVIVLGVQAGGVFLRASTFLPHNRVAKVLAEAPCPIFAVHGQH